MLIFTCRPLSSASLYALPTRSFPMIVVKAAV